MSSAIADRNSFTADGWLECVRAPGGGDCTPGKSDERRMSQSMTPKPDSAFAALQHSLGWWPPHAWGSPRHRAIRTDITHRATKRRAPPRRTAQIRHLTVARHLCRLHRHPPPDDPRARRRCALDFDRHEPRNSSYEPSLPDCVPAPRASSMGGRVARYMERGAHRLRAGKVGAELRPSVQRAKRQHDEKVLRLAVALKDPGSGAAVLRMSGVPHSLQWATAMPQRSGIDASGQAHAPRIEAAVLRPTW